MKMKEGERAVMTIPAKYAFGDQVRHRADPSVPMRELPLNIGASACVALH